ncbi:Ig-like domain-containing protein [Niallia taxi]|uniref:Ig-like domain-containing protein n=1 Tax=Niallia taxi TaxID=2499688 RepID=UPI002934711E|nr:Ig-like domain-containing protein [Niallia taxi]WOD61743.1 Ig-like domain-containing protein [Niallia taxi]
MGESPRFKLMSFIFGLVCFFIFLQPNSSNAAPDVNAPLVSDVEIELPDKEVLDNGDWIHVRANVTDDISGVDTINARFKGPLESSFNIKLQAVYDKDEQIAYYEGGYSLSTYDPRGKWYFVSLSAMDRVDNQKIYTKDELGITNNVSFDYGYKNVESNKGYTTSVTPIFNGNALLNGYEFESGETITEEGQYILKIYEPSGSRINVTFSIDRTAPTFSGVVNNGVYNKDVTISFSEDRASLSFYRYGEYVLAEYRLPQNYNLKAEGKYHLVVEDEAGNATDAYFIIDKTAPSITSSLSTSKPTNKDITISVTSKDEENGFSSFPFKTGVDYVLLPNGKQVKGDKASYKVTKNGSYTFKVTDKAGNIKSKTVKVTNIDKTAPKVESSVSTTKATNKDVEVKITSSDSSNIENITLPNKKTVKSSSTKYKVSKNGSYTFKVKDKAGNVTSKTVKVSNIDKSAPGKASVNKVTSKSKSVTGKAEKNTTVYVYKGSKQLGKATVNSKGAYTVKIAAQKKNTKLSVYVQDKAGNKGKAVSVTVK